MITGESNEFVLEIHTGMPVNRLIEWGKEAHKDVAPRHYLLCPTPEMVDFQKSSPLPRGSSRSPTARNIQTSSSSSANLCCAKTSWIGPSQATDAGRALLILTPFNVSLSVAAEFYKTQATFIQIKKTVGQVADELLEAKAQDNLSARHRKKPSIATQGRVRRR